MNRLENHSDAPGPANKITDAPAKPEPTEADRKKLPPNEAKDTRMQPENKELTSKQSENNKHPRLQPREAQQQSDPNELRQPNNPNEVRQLNNPSEVRQPNNSGEARRPNNPNEVRQPNNPNEVRQPNNPSEVRQPNNPSEVRQSNNPSEVRQPNDSGEARWPNNPNEVRQPNNLNEVQQPNNSNEVRQPYNNNDVRQPGHMNDDPDAGRSTRPDEVRERQSSPAADALRGGEVSPPPQTDSGAEPEKQGLWDRLKGFFSHNGEKTPEKVPETTPEVAPKRTFDGIELKQAPNNIDYVVPGNHYDDYQKVANDRPQRIEGDNPVKYVSPDDIEGVDLFKGDVDNPSSFWGHLGGSQDGWYNMASQIPEVRARLDNGESLQSLLQDDRLGSCANAYFNDATSQGLVRVNQLPNGGYEYTGNGRHRILAARAVGEEIPVKIMGVYK